MIIHNFSILLYFSGFENCPNSNHWLYILLILQFSNDEDFYEDDYFCSTVVMQIPREIYRRQCTEDVKGFNLTSSPVSKNSFFQPKWMTTLQTQDEKPFWVDESMVHLCARKVILLLFNKHITLCYFLHCCPKIQFWPKLDLFEFCVKIEG